jgi:23S rRNA (pseudouridine1915-N3)-methyltransferase
VKFVFLTCASANETWSKEAEELYQKKISYFVPFENKALKIKKNSRDDRNFKVKTDSEALMAELKPDDFVILFDERGQSLDSLKFSKKMENILNSGKKRAVFIIGGAYGVDQSVVDRADLKISFSVMVMNHLVAQTVALEQIYRSFMILKNLPYHNL